MYAYHKKRALPCLWDGAGCKKKSWLLQSDRGCQATSLIVVGTSSAQPFFQLFVSLLSSPSLAHPKRQQLEHHGRQYVESTRQTIWQ